MTAALEGSEWSAARPGHTLPPGKTRYPFYRRLCGHQDRSGRAENLVPSGIRSRTVQPVVSRYTDWATRHNFVLQNIITIIQWHVFGRRAASRYFRDWLRPHLQDVAGGLVETRMSVSSWKNGKFHTWTRLSALENFFKFCLCGSFKTINSVCYYYYYYYYYYYLNTLFIILHQFCLGYMCWS